MPRGGRPKARTTTRNEVPERKTRRSTTKTKTVTEVRRGPPRGSKKMDNASEKSVSRKRKQTAIAAVPVKKVKVVTNGSPPAKKAKITASKEEPTPALAVDEPDRAVEPQTSPAKSKGHGKDKSKVRNTSQAVPKTQEAPSMPAPSDKETVSHHSHRKQAGQVMVMGQGDTGQLGLGEDIMEKKMPFPVGGVLENMRVVQVTCGGMHTAALTENGQVFTWGCNDEGALGRETKDGEEYSPELVSSLKGVDIIQLSAGNSHTAALADNGEVYCWGVFRDSNGPFGLLHADSPSPVPQVVYSCPSNRAIKLASGCEHVVLLTSNSDVITFGCAEQGQLGRVPEVFSSRGGRKGIQFLLQPQAIRFRKTRNAPPPRFLDVFCGSYHTFALTEDEAVYTWGLNNYGQLGTDDMDSRFQPQRLPQNWIQEEQADSVKENVRREDNSSKGRRYEGLMISGGQHHTVLCNKGSVYVIGRREYGRLGLGSNSSLEPATPTRVPTLSEVTEVSASTVCSFAVSEAGDLYSWGMGTNLQLGNGEEDDVWTPCKVAGKKLEGRKVLLVSGGGQHTALIAHSPKKTGKK